jgi:hypothetical protein
MKLLLALVLVARPVQAPFRGEVESLDFAGHSTGVLASFEPGTKAAQGKAAIDACTPAASGRVTVTAAFLRTTAAQLAVVLPPQPATARALLALAACLSKQAGVKETHAWFFPAGDSGVEVEAVWRYQQGVKLDRAVLSFRDDVLYPRFVRRAVTRAELVQHQWSSEWPLTRLAKKLALPGRDALERPAALMWEGLEAPADAGEDLARAMVFLDKRTAIALMQEAEVTRSSPSRLVTEALRNAQQAKALGEGGDEEPATQGRGFQLFLPRPLIAEVEAFCDAKGESFSTVVQKAWAHAHGEKKKE